LPVSHEEGNWWLVKGKRILGTLGARLLVLGSGAMGRRLLFCAMNLDVDWVGARFPVFVFFLTFVLIV